MKAYSETSMHYIYRNLMGENLPKETPHPTWDFLINNMKERALYSVEHDFYDEDRDIATPKFTIYAIPMVDHPAFNIIIHFDSTKIMLNRMLDIINKGYLANKLYETIKFMKEREGDCYNDPFGIVMIDDAFENPYANTDSNKAFKLVAQLYDNSVMVLTNAQNHQFSLEVHGYDKHSDFSLEIVKADQDARDLIENCKENNRDIGDFGAIAMITTRYIYMYLSFMADAQRRINLLNFTPCGESC